MTSSCTEGRSKITTLGLRRSSLYTKSLIELSCKRKMEPELKVTASYAVATSLRLKLVFITVTAHIEVVVKVCIETYQNGTVVYVTMFA